jgi:hypothetical protein
VCVFVCRREREREREREQEGKSVCEKELEREKGGDSADRICKHFLYFSRCYMNSVTLYRFDLWPQKCNGPFF